MFVYQIESYRYWQEQLGRTDFVYGQFGENFTVEGLPDDGVYIGDRYAIGSALFEVTQPRVTCYRVGIRMNESRMAALLTSSGRPGFYFRVLNEGEVGAGDEIVKVEEGKERMSVAEVNALLYSPQHPRDRLERASQIAALSPGWRSSFIALLGSRSDGNAGLGARIGCAPGRARIPAAEGDGDRPGIGRCRVADDAAPRRRAAAGSAAGPVRRAAPSTKRRRRAALSQLLAFRTPLDGSLPDQREDRAQRRGGRLPEGPRAGGRCSRDQLAARKLHPAVRRGPVALLSAGIGATPVACDAPRHVVGACVKAKPVKSDERLEKALRELRRTNNQAKAAKEAGVAPERFRRFLCEQKLAERKGRIWEITNKRPRVMTALTTRGELELKLPGFDEASLVGQHNAAVKAFRDTNDISHLQPFEGRTVKDTSGRKYVLETRPNVIRRRDASGETFEQIYRIVE